MNPLNSNSAVSPSATPSAAPSVALSVLMMRFKSVNDYALTYLQQNSAAHDTAANMSTTTIFDLEKQRKAIAAGLVTNINDEIIVNADQKKGELDIFFDMPREGAEFDEEEKRKRAELQQKYGFTPTCVKLNDFLGTLKNPTDENVEKAQFIMQTVAFKFDPCEKSKLTQTIKALPGRLIEAFSKILS